MRSCSLLTNQPLTRKSNTARKLCCRSLRPECMEQSPSNVRTRFPTLVRKENRNCFPPDWSGNNSFTGSWCLVDTQTIFKLNLASAITFGLPVIRTEIHGAGKPLKLLGSDVWRGRKVAVFQPLHANVPVSAAFRKLIQVGHKD